ncbi:hypothetical protein [Methylobacterium durans]|uniref:DUF1236 domain-containing protein n=1 Tax=Methylobacterium durans TaxID=2202825 RepID=A0A2U8W9L6_9HYPH|nr:hypothetical protein [Methylobacterium durans]AWN42834.1 hypothetical protein DK389_22945 [Methylobacterium durans]
MDFHVLRKTNLVSVIGLVAASVLTSSAALTQPLILRVNPRLADQGLLMSGNDSATIQTLFDTGPRYQEPSGVRVGRGSVIPGWVQMGSFQNVSVTGLNPTGYYGYYISPDDRAVVIDLDSRRVVRVIPR